MQIMKVMMGKRRVKPGRKGENFSLRKMHLVVYFDWFVLSLCGNSLLKHLKFPRQRVLLQVLVWFP